MSLRILATRVLAFFMKCDSKSLRILSVISSEVIRLKNVKVFSLRWFLSVGFCLLMGCAVLVTLAQVLLCSHLLTFHEDAALDDEGCSSCLLAAAMMNFSSFNNQYTIYRNSQKIYLKVYSL